jgi:hypothetical protein
LGPRCRFWTERNVVDYQLRCHEIVLNVNALIAAAAATVSRTLMRDHGGRELSQLLVFRNIFASLRRQKPVRRVRNQNRAMNVHS